MPQADVDRRFYALVTDHIDTPVGLLDPATGTLAGHAHASMWGQLTWTGTDTPWRYPGQYHDPESGLHYNHHRYYQPDTGRYLTPDPLGLAPAPNPYGYPGNPTTFADPFGLSPCKLDEVLKDFNNRRFRFGNVDLLLDHGDMRHILTRHHPDYWYGSVKRSQTFFDDSPLTDDLVDRITETLKQNRDTIVERGAMDFYTLQGRVGGIDYQLGISRGHIGQFFPLPT